MYCLMRLIKLFAEIQKCTNKLMYANLNGIKKYFSVTKI